MHDDVPGIESAIAQQLDRLSNPVVLDAWLSKIDGALDGRAADVDLLRWRANLLRATGRLAEAAAAYRRLTHDPFAQGLATMLEGSGTYGQLPGGVAPFVRLTNFLDEERQEKIWRAVRERQSGLVRSEIGDVGENGVDERYRKSVVLNNADAVAEWFVPMVEQAIERKNIVARLRLPPFSFGNRELQITCHGDGDYFNVHRDQGERGTMADRLVTFVYYFHSEPRRFSGGDLLLFDEDDEGSPMTAPQFTRIIPGDNSIVFFVSDRLHTVTRVSADTADPMLLRWTANGWIQRVRAQTAVGFGS